MNVWVQILEILPDAKQTCPSLHGTFSQSALHLLSRKPPSTQTQRGFWLRIKTLLRAEILVLTSHSCIPG